MPNLIDSEPGVILHTRPYKEHSLLVELYTLNYGRVSAVARVSKKAVLTLLVFTNLLFY